MRTKGIKHVLTSAKEKKACFAFKGKKHMMCMLQCLSEMNLTDELTPSSIH